LNKTSSVSHIECQNASSRPLNPHHRNQSADSADNVTDDVLAGFARHIVLLWFTHPERLPAYRRQIAAMVDELHRTGKSAETPRFAAFDTLLDIAAVAR
jgi:hypothetical protein